MFIDINTLGPEGLAFDRVLPLSGLEGPSREPLEPVEARLRGTILPRSGGRADLQGRLEAAVSLQCGRCLERFAWVARAGFDLEVVRSEGSPEGETGGAVDDPAEILVAPEGRITLEEVATEQLYLLLPLKPICSPDCKGLCPNCGVNRNLEPCGCASEEIDPRMAPLLPFRQKKILES